MLPLNIYYQNVRGIRTKTTDIFLNILNHNYDIVILTETWLNDTIFDSELIDDRYTVFRRDRQLSAFNKKLDGGGILVAVTKELQAQRRCDWESSAEDLWISLRLSQVQVF